MKTSRPILLSLLAAGLGLAIWLGLRLAAHAPGEAGSGAPLADQVEGGTGAAAVDLQAPARDPASLADGADGGAGGAQAAEAGVASPAEATRTVSGRVILADGGGLPAHLAVHARRTAPWPRLATLRGMIRDEPEFDLSPSASVSRPAGEELAAATRVEVAPDLTFVMPGVPATGAFIAVDDEQLYVDPVARVEPGADSVEVRLVRGGILSGIVTGPDGQPVADARVAGGTTFDPFMVFDGAARMVSLERLRTDADGRFRFLRVPAGFAFTVGAAADGRPLQPARADVPPLVAGEAREVDLRLAEASTIAGHVRRPDGTPLAGAGVLIRRSDLNLKNVSIAGMELDDGEDEATTDAEGAFRFEGVADGSWDVMLSQAGFRLAKTSLRGVAGGHPVPEVSLLAEAGLAVAGTVVDDAGQPVPSATVRGFPPPSMVDFRTAMERELRPTATTDEQGRFELGGFDEGKVRVRANAPAFQAGQVDVQAGDHAVVLRLERSCAVSGIVVALDDGEPVATFDVGLLPSKGLFDMSDPFGIADRMEGVRPSRSFRNTEDGSFTIDDIRPGTYDVKASAKGFGPVTRKALEVGAEGRKGIVLMLPPEATVTGLVVDGPTGRPVEGASVSIGGGGSIMETVTSGMLADGPRATTDGQGRFRLGGLPPEPVKLLVQHSDYKDLGIPELVLAPGEQRDLGVLSLSAGAAVFGKVLDGLGHGVAGVQVMVAEATGRSFKRTTTDDVGAYRVGGLPAGTFNVMRMDFTMSLGGEGGPMDFLKDMVMQAITLTADEQKEVDLVARAAGAGTRLYGDVTESGKPVPGALVSAVPEQGGMAGMAFSTTDKAGHYELAGLKPGSFAFQVLPLEGSGVAAGSMSGSPVIEKLAVAGGEQRHDVPLPGGEIAGVVESTADGSHVPGLRVLLERTDDGMPHLGLLKALGGRVGEVYTDKDGAFRFRHLPVGTFDVVAGGRNAAGIGAEGWAVARLRDVRVAGGGPGFTVHVKVAPAGGIAGRVTDTAGSPLSGVSLWFQDSQGRWASTFSEVTTDPTGAYACHSLDKGLWNVAFRDGSHALRIVPEVLVRVGETATVDTTLEAGVALNLDTGGRDPYALQIAIDGPDGVLPTGLVAMDQLMAQDGSELLTRLGVFAPGPYHLKVMEGADTLLDTTVVLVAGSGAKVVSLGS